MKRDYIDFICDMLTSIKELYEIMGEAANRIPVEIQEKYPSIMWRDIIGMRNIIIHSYDKVDARQLWNVIKFRLKPLEDDLNQMLSQCT